MKNEITNWEDVDIGEVFICENLYYQKSTSRTAYCYKEKRKFTFRKGMRCHVIVSAKEGES